MPMRSMIMWRNILFGKMMSGAAYGAAANIYKPSNIAEMELTTPQCLLLTLLHSLVGGDVMSCVSLAEICHRVQRLRSRHHKVWLLEEFVFPRADVEKALTFLVELVSDGILKLPSHVIAIMNSLAKKYKITGVDLKTLSEEYRGDLAIQLEMAVSNNNPSDIFDLVSEGADVFRSTRFGDSLLHLAARAESSASIAALAFLNTDLEVVNSSNATPLEEAVRCDSASSVKALLSAGAKLDKRLVRGNSYLHIAAEGAHNEALQALLEVGIRVNEKNRFGGTPLSKAVIAANERGIELLLENGADFSDLRHIRLNDGDSVVHSVARSGNDHILKLLKDMKIPANVRNNKGVTPLHVASNPLVIRTLLGMGASIDIQDNNGSTPLMMAARNLNADIVSLLLLNRSDLTIKDKEGRTALHYAAEGGCLGSVTTLLHAGAKVDDQDNNGDTPAFLAAVNNNPLVLQLLIERIDLALRDNNGDGILHREARCGHVKVVKALLEAGATVDMEGKDQWTALHYAADKGYIAVVKTLLDAGAAVNKKCEFHRTALHLAAEKGHVAVVTHLLDRGADPGAGTKWGYTPLILACIRHRMAVVELLVDRGVDVNARDHEGKNALHWAVECNRSAVANYLRSKGAIL